MIGYYGLVTGLAVALLLALYALVSQPQAVAIERTKTEAAVAHAAVLETRVALIPTLTPSTRLYPYGNP